MAGRKEKHIGNPYWICEGIKHYLIGIEHLYLSTKHNQKLLRFTMLSKLNFIEHKND